MQHFGDIAFTDHVKAEQELRGSREMYAGMTARPAPTGIGEREADGRGRLRRRAGRGRARLVGGDGQGGRHVEDRS